MIGLDVPGRQGHYKKVKSGIPRKDTGSKSPRKRTDDREDAHHMASTATESRISWDSVGERFGVSYFD